MGLLARMRVLGVFAEEFVVGGFAGEGDGVAVGLGAVAPAVQDG